MKKSKKLINRNKLNTPLAIVLENSMEDNSIDEEEATPSHNEQMLQTVSVVEEHNTQNFVAKKSG